MNGLLLFTVDECSFVYYPGATIPQKGPMVTKSGVLSGQHSLDLY